MKPKHKKNRSHPFDSKDVLSVREFELSERVTNVPGLTEVKYVDKLLNDGFDVLYENGSYSYKKAKHPGHE